jgi:hypothetical protein
MPEQLRVYVAGASADMSDPIWAMNQLREKGAIITLDWTPMVKSAIASGNTGNCLDNLPLAATAARCDIAAVRTAHVVWIVTPKSREHGCGLWVEMGAAIAYGVHVVISGPQASRSIFAALCERHISHEGALSAVLQYGTTGQ